MLPLIINTQTIKILNTLASHRLNIPCPTKKLLNLEPGPVEYPGIVDCSWLNILYDENQHHNLNKLKQKVRR